MLRRPPRSTRTDTLFPYTTLFRSHPCSLVSRAHLIIKKPDVGISKDISATRLSRGDPVGFPPHPRGWFSIVVYQLVRISSRSEEHTSELQSLMRISYAVFCLTKKTRYIHLKEYTYTLQTQTI